jgi:hypothetical protein
MKHYAFLIFVAPILEKSITTLIGSLGSEASPPSQGKSQSIDGIVLILHFVKFLLLLFVKIKPYLLQTTKQPICIFTQNCMRLFCTQL